MGSSGSQKLVPTTSQILPISELIDHINRSNGKSHLNYPENLLREYNTKMEIENLTRSRNAVKREVCELDRSLDMAELLKLKLEDDLRKTQMKCEELEKTVALLMEEKKKTERLAKGYKNRYQMFSSRLLKIEKDLALLNANRGHFSKIAQPSSAAAADDIIAIRESDEGESETYIVSQRSKRNRADVDGLIVHSTAKKKRDMGRQVLESSEERIDCSSSSRKCVGEEEAGQASEYQTPPENLKDNSASTGSDR